MTFRLGNRAMDPTELAAFGARWKAAAKRGADLAARFREADGQFTTRANGDMALMLGDIRAEIRTTNLTDDPAEEGTGPDSMHVVVLVEPDGTEHVCTPAHHTLIDAMAEVTRLKREADREADGA